MSPRWDFLGSQDYMLSFLWTLASLSGDALLVHYVNPVRGSSPQPVGPKGGLCLVIFHHYSWMTVSMHARSWLAWRRQDEERMPGFESLCKVWFSPFPRKSLVNKTSAQSPRWPFVHILGTVIVNNRPKRTSLSDAMALSAKSFVWCVTM